MAVANPFTERSRITRAEHFIGRWRELSLIFDRLEARRPVIVAGVAGVGKSSLLTHIAQSAATTLEQPELEALYVDMTQLDAAPAFYTLLTNALSSSGDNAAAFEFALIERGAPVLLALDNAETAIAAGWGELVLEALARIARRSRPLPSYETASLEGATDLMIVAVVTGSAPQLSEPFAAITLGAVATAEVRLLAEAYLDGTNVSFAPNELRELWQMSAGHPAYLQRAAYHLFRAKTEPGYDWRAAFRAEVRDLPLPGAPLPPGVFEGNVNPSRESGYDEVIDEGGIQRPTLRPAFELGSAFIALLALVLALIVWRVTGNLLIGAAIFVVGIVATVLLQRRSRSER